MKDFFFKTLSTNKKQSSLYLSELRDLTTEFSPDFLKKQINRLLKDAPGHTLIMACGTSHPDFLPLLELFNAEEIGQIIISYRTDLNSNVNRTLECTLILEEGAINIRAHWCAYKAMRADEMVTTLLRPILLFGYEKITYLLDNPEGDKESICREDLEGLLSYVFTLSGYPLHAQYLEDNEVQRWLRYLSVAQDVATTGLPNHEREDRYYKILRED